MNERKTIIYNYKKMKIKIHIKKQMINICVLEREVRIGKHNKLNHKNECQLNRLFGQSEWKKYECNDKGINEMLLWLNEYEEERRNVANRCREQVKETYFKEHKSCFS